MSDNLQPQSPSSPAAFDFRFINRGTDSNGRTLYTPVSVIDVGGEAGESLLVLGQATMAASLPVVIASNQGPLTVNLGTLNGVALDTSVNGILVAQASATSGEKGPLVQGAATTGAPTYVTGNTYPLSLTLAGALRVDGSAVTQPVSVSGNVTLAANSSINLTQVGGSAVALGQVTMAASIPVTLASNQSALAVSQSGTWNVGTLTSITNAVTVSQATAANLQAQVQGPAASGAAKSGNPVQHGAVFNSSQPTVTTGQVVEAQATARGALIVATGVDNFTVQQGGSNWSANIAQVGGSSIALGQTTMASSLPVAIASNQGNVPVSQATASSLNAQVVGNVASGSSDSGNPVKAGGVYNSAAPTPSTGQRVDLQMDSSGNLKVNVAAGSSGNAAASATGSAVPADADYLGLNVGGTLRGWTGSNPSGSVFAGQVDLVSVAGTAYSLGQVAMANSLSVCIATNQSNIPCNVTQIGGSALALGQTTMASSIPVTLASNQSAISVSQSGSWSTQPVSGTGSGASMFTLVSTASNNSTQIKSSGGNVYSIVVINTTGTIYYLKLFDGAPTMGTTSANWNIPVPANTSAAGVVVTLPVGLTFASTINMALTGGIGLTDNSNAATGVAVNVAYK